MPRDGWRCELPTGDNAATDVFPDNNGNNNVERYVDISVHPGDGGWGILFDVQGYKTIGRIVTFGSGTWLANPRNTGTASRGNLVTTAAPTNVNTVSDQFVFRAGTSVSITPRIAASLAWRMEGVPRYDLIGRSDGFRRPGVEMYWEPGVTLTAGRHSVSLNVPFGYYFNRFRNPYTGNPGDSTFPEVVAIATYSVRLGRPQIVNHGPTDQPPPGLTPPIGPQADTFKPFTLKTVDGVERRLSDVLGKATLVVFFFPTCVYCNAAFPSIQRLHDTYRNEGLSTVWINAVPEEDQLIRAWQMEHGYTVPILLGTRSAQNDYRLTTTPTYYLLDSQGHVLLRQAGYTAGDERDLEREIRRMLVSAE